MSSCELVVVVGAGPIGLIAALALRRQRVPVLVIDANAHDRVAPEGRPVFLTKGTLRRLEYVQPGLGRAIATEGTQVTGVDGDGPLPSPRVAPLTASGTNLSWRAIEQIMSTECVRLGIKFRGDSPVRDLTADGRGVRVKLGSDDAIHASYVIATDGIRPVVRNAIGVSMEGPPNLAVADSFTDVANRVLLAGPAAHVLTAVEAHDLNAGIVDATDAAYAIARALTAPDPVAARRIIQTCADDRREWALHIRKVSDRALRASRYDSVMQGALEGARMAPLSLSGGAGLATGPIPVPFPRPRSRSVS